MPDSYGKIVFMEINPRLFRRYDVRGVYPDEFNETAAGAIAATFARYCDEQRLDGPIIVGCDVRLSSRSLQRACIEMIQKTGRDVIEIGVVTTPLFYFSIGATPAAAGGIMITASHNPPQYNGMKFVVRGSRHLSFENGIGRIQELTEGQTQRANRAARRGTISERDYSPDYQAFLCAKGNITRSLFFIVDAANGAAGAFLPSIFECLGVRYEPLYFEPDGTFPNHPPNPLDPESYRTLAETIRTRGADGGILFDADGDRVVFFDERGEAIRSDVIGAFLAAHLIAKGELVLADVTVSRAARDYIKKAGGRYMSTCVGTPYIKEAMRRQNARFAFEASGHFYYREFFFSDSAFLTMIYFFNAFSRVNKKLSKALLPLAKFAHSGELNFSATDWEALRSRIESQYPHAVRSTIDGLTMEFPDWWFNVRPSATEPLVRLNIEANTPEILEQKKEELVAIVKQ